MAGFLPKDYVGVHTRVQKAHDKYKDLTIETEFDVKGELVIFKAIVKFEGKVFNGSSLGTIGREKAFEKLETVAVGRALAFAGFEIKDGIASEDEIERFNNFEDKRDLLTIINELKQAETLDIANDLKEEAKLLAKTEKQQEWLKKEYSIIYNNLKQ